MFFSGDSCSSKQRGEGWLQGGWGERTEFIFKRYRVSFRKEEKFLDVGDGDGYTTMQVGTSLVVQWLRPHAPHAGALGSIPAQGTRSRRPQLRAGVPQLREPCVLQWRLQTLSATIKTKYQKKTSACIFNATKLCIFKWLNIESYVYFATIKKKKRLKENLPKTND